MDKKDYEVFAQTYKKVEAICTEIMNKLAYKPNENPNTEDYVITLEYPEFQSLIVKENDSVEFAYYEDDGFGNEQDMGTLVIPKEVVINENIDDWCERAIAEHKREVEEFNKELQARKEADERALYERLKKKYGDS